MRLAKIAAEPQLRLHRDQGILDMTDTALSSLVMAWSTCTIATTLFVAALALSRVWDNGVYFQGLKSALGLDV